MYVLFSSYGNDSLAVMQLLHEWSLRELGEIHVVYSNTGWAAPWWAQRVEKAEAWGQELGFQHHRTTSEGLPNLVRRKKAWPRQGIQFCTTELKIKPAIAWLDEHDPERQAVCVVGVRRAESNARAHWPEWQKYSPNHGRRTLWAPMVDLSSEERDDIVRRTPFTPLPHRSKECYPCINDNRRDLQLLDEQAIQKVERLETEMGFTSKGKPRTMFRPYRHMGACGIREIVRWAHSKRGEFDADDGTGYDCEGGFCGL